MPIKMSDLRFQIGAVKQRPVSRSISLVCVARPSECLGIVGSVIMLTADRYVLPSVSKKS